MTTAKPSAKHHNLRNRKGGFTARCERCNCPAGCACSPAEPCFCGTNPDGSEREEVSDSPSGLVTALDTTLTDPSTTAFAQAMAKAGAAEQVRISVNETEKRSREQGYFFAITEVGGRWEQFGYVMWHDVSLAFAEGRAAVTDGRCRQFTVSRNDLREPFRSVEVSE